MRAISVINAVATDPRQSHQGQRLASHMGLTLRIFRIGMAVHQSTQSRMMGQGHRQDQPRIGRQVVPVKGNVDAGELIRW